MNTTRARWALLLIAVLVILIPVALNAQSRVGHTGRSSTSTTNLSDVDSADELDEYLKTNFSDLLYLVCGADLSGCNEADCHDAEVDSNPILIASIGQDALDVQRKHQVRYFPICTVKWSLSFKYSWGPDRSIQVTTNADGSWTIKGTYKGIEGSATSTPPKKQDQPPKESPTQETSPTPPAPSEPSSGFPPGGVIEITRSPASGPQISSESGSASNGQPPMQSAPPSATPEANGNDVSRSLNDPELRLAAGEPFSLVLDVSGIPDGDRILRSISREFQRIEANRGKMFLDGRFHPETYNQLSHSVSNLRSQLEELIGGWPSLSANLSTQRRSETLHSLAFLVGIVETMSWELESIGNAVQQSNH